MTEEVDAVRGKHALPRVDLQARFSQPLEYLLQVPKMLLQVVRQVLGPLSLVTSVPIASNPNPHLCASSLVFSCVFSLVLLVLPLVC